MQNYKLYLNAVNIHIWLVIEYLNLPAFKFSDQNPNMATHIPPQPTETPIKFLPSKRCTRQSSYQLLVIIGRCVSIDFYEIGMRPGISLCVYPLGTALPLYRTGVSLLSRERFLYI